MVGLDLLCLIWFNMVLDILVSWVVVFKFNFLFLCRFFNWLVICDLNIMLVMWKFFIVCYNV